MMEHNGAHCLSVNSAVNEKYIQGSLLFWPENIKA